VAIVADSGALYALYDVRDAHHATVRQAIEHERGPFLVPMAILAEVDYLLRTYLGIDAELDFLDGIAQGFYILIPLVDADLSRCQELIAQYRDNDLGLADTAVIATAERLGIQRILTVDERHFRVIRGKKGQTFTLLPADEQE
jgi:predicted nucleic acid-binding protein